ncbi:hypothetical protein K501DRAFT_249791 [Backusella circina FSU 941]|nr:hypothetical protein K501DRAFT_249791 [Backusella circina FSU 941]
MTLQTPTTTTTTTTTTTAAAAGESSSTPTTGSVNYANDSRALVNEQQVESFLLECGLSQYLSIFIEEGFDRLESLFEITEADLMQMQVKRGHRRLLQRAVASARGIPTTVPLNIAPLNKPSPDVAQSRVTYPLPSQQQQQQQQQQITRMEPPISSDGSQQPYYLHNTINNNNNNLLVNSNIKVPPTATPSTLPPAAPIRPTLTTNYTHRFHNNDNTNNNSKNKNIKITNKKPTTGNEYYASAGTMIHTTASGMSSTEEEAVTSDNVHRLWKRKYHRHAKPDSNAPLKPPSAYVMFSNDVRQELKDENRSFTDLAKIIGDRWKNISVEEKERYETNALAAREEYLKKVEEYQKTDAYKQYQQYITDFKAQNEAAARPVGRPRKRHRKEGDKWVSDGTVSDYSTHTRRASSTSSQLEEVNQQKHYLQYLLNDDNSTPPLSSSSSTMASSSTPQTDQQSMASSSTSSFSK